MNLIWNVQVPVVFKMHENMVKEWGTSWEQIPPETLNTLVMTAFACNETATIGASKWMGKHHPSNINIFTSLISTDSWWESKCSHSIIEQSNNSSCSVVIATMKIHDSPWCPIYTSMNNKIPPKNHQEENKLLHTVQCDYSAKVV